MDMENPAPIFILCSERSGSTLLRYILDTHPDIYSPGELQLGMLINYLHVSISRTLGLVAGEPDGTFGPTTQKEIHQIISGFMEDQARARGKKIWCEKTPYNLLHLPMIRWAFPAARYICLHRNSWDVIRSCVELPVEKIPNWILHYRTVFPRSAMAAWMGAWLDKTSVIVKMERDLPGQAFRIRYEDLVSDPVAALDPLFKFLGLEWKSSMLDRVFSTPHDLGGGDDKILKTERIMKDRVGLGQPPNPEWVAQVPENLLKQRDQFHQILGYPL